MRCGPRCGPVEAPIRPTETRAGSIPPGTRARSASRNPSDLLRRARRRVEERDPFERRRRDQLDHALASLRPCPRSFRHHHEAVPHRDDRLHREQRSDGGPCRRQAAALPEVVERVDRDVQVDVRQAPVDFRCDLGCGSTARGHLRRQLDRDPGRHRGRRRIDDVDLPVGQGAGCKGGAAKGGGQPGADRQAHDGVGAIREAGLEGSLEHPGRRGRGRREGSARGQHPCPELLRRQVDPHPELLGPKADEQRHDANARSLDHGRRQVGGGIGHDRGACHGLLLPAQAAGSRSNGPPMR